MADCPQDGVKKERCTRSQGLVFVGRGEAPIGLLTGLFLEICEKAQWVKGFLSNLVA